MTCEKNHKAALPRKCSLLKSNLTTGFGAVFVVISQCFYPASASLVAIRTCIRTIFGVELAKACERNALVPVSRLAGHELAFMSIAINIGDAPTLEPAKSRTAAQMLCLHCGTLCAGSVVIHNEQHFCCTGCRTVYELLTENGLGEFYQLNRTTSSPVRNAPAPDKYCYLDDPTLRKRFVDYSDEHITRVTFRLPVIHCVACVWLLENLFQLEPGIGRTTVHFARQEATVVFETARVQLSQVARLLESIGYEPDLKLADLDRRAHAVPRRLWLQLGVAGFVFGNTMLFSLPAYFGLDSASGPAFRMLVGWLSLALSLPVVAFSAADYWRASWISFQQRRMTMDVPIALGIAALFLQSSAEVILGRGEGFFDSLAGLLFFLLCGKVFQHKTFERLSFDRDYRSFFPLSVCRRDAVTQTEHRVGLQQVAVGDRLVVRHGELIPADAQLVQGSAEIDYSFVTGESEPVFRSLGEHLYAGGRQVGGLIEVETVKPVSQSHLTSLWNQAAFRKSKDDTFNTITNQYSRRFTWIILGIAVGAALFWAFNDPSKSVKSFTGVLIVACPCALALAAPFTLGAAVRSLGRRGIFLRNAEVIETLARVDTVVFDKTGTLTAAQRADVQFEGAPLDTHEALAVYRIASQSSHPLSKSVLRWLETCHPDLTSVPHAGVGESTTDFREVPGSGIEGRWSNRLLRLGSAAFTNAETPQTSKRLGGSEVHLAIDGVSRGRWTVSSQLRPEVGQLIQGLSAHHELALLSGDNERDRAQFQRLFGGHSRLHFNQSPLNKLGYVRDLQREGRTVMMVGDGLNDAGALQQGDVGVAVVESVGGFSPASDVILHAAYVPRLGELLDYARQAVRVVRSGFFISTLYNLVGIGIAASGNLSPVVCAILMPVSSVTVIAFSSGITTWLGNRSGLAVTQPMEPSIP